MRDTGAYAELQSNFYDRVFMVSNIRHDDNDTFGKHITYRLAPAVLLPVIDTRLKASYGTGLQSADAQRALRQFSGLRLFRKSQSPAGKLKRL